MDVKDITYIDGTVFKTTQLDDSLPTLVLPSFEELKQNKRAYAESFKVQYSNCDPFTAKRLAEPYGKEYVVQNPPQKPLSMEEMDAVYDLPYCRTYHPSYEKLGGVPAIEEVKFSLVSNRGCFGACSFCALTFHQGRIVQVRSHESILKEAEQMVQDKDFKGYIHDVGGPTANFRHPACAKQMTKGACGGGNACTPPPAKTSMPTIPTMWRCCGSCGKSPGSKRYSSAAAFALTICWQSRNRPSSGNWCSIMCPVS